MEEPTELLNYPPHPTPSLRHELDRFRENYCWMMLWRFNGHMTNAAKALGIHRNTLTKILNRSKKEKP